MELGKVINRVTKFVQIHEFTLGDQVWVKDWKHDLLAPQWKGPYSEVARSCPTLGDPIDCSLPGFFVHGIFQARVLEWVAISFSRGSS